VYKSTYCQLPSRIRTLVIRDTQFVMHDSLYYFIINSAPIAYSIYISYAEKRRGTTVNEMSRRYKLCHDKQLASSESICISYCDATLQLKSTNPLSNNYRY